MWGTINSQTRLYIIIKCGRPTLRLDKVYVHSTEQYIFIILVFQSKTVSHTDRAKGYINRSCYERGFSLLFKQSKAARKALATTLTRFARQEMLSLLQPSGQLCKTIENMDSVSDFGWLQLFSEVRQQCPFLYSVLLGCLTTQRGAKTLSLRGRKGRSVIGPVATIASLLGFYCRPTKAKYLQELVSLQMWLGGCKRQVRG